MRLVIVLIIPATVGLYALAQPVVALAFEHGGFTAADTQVTSQVLRFYLIGLPFAAVDQLLIFASYPRKDTLTPALVGVFSVVIYLAVAVVLLRPMGLFSLMIADSIKHIFHAGIMTFLLHRRLGDLKEQLTLTTGKAILAAAIMGCTVWIFSLALPDRPDLLRRLVLVAGGGTAGLLIYLLLITWLRVPEVQLLRTLLRSRFRANKEIE